MFNKGIQNNAFVQGFDPKSWSELFEIAHDAVMAGNIEAWNIIENNEFFPKDKTLISDLVNKTIINVFTKKIKSSIKWSGRTSIFTSYRMVYMLVDRKFFICFKALGKKGIIEGMKTKRFDDTIYGRPFSISKSMMQELQKLNLTDIPPLLFVGFDRNEKLINKILFQHYYNRKVSFEFTLIKNQTKFLLKNKNIINPNIVNRIANY